MTISLHMLFTYKYMHKIYISPQLMQAAVIDYLQPQANELYLIWWNKTA